MRNNLKRILALALSLVMTVGTISMVSADLTSATVSGNFNAWLWVSGENDSNGDRLIESLYDVAGDGNALGMNTTDSYSIEIPFRTSSGTVKETVEVKPADLTGMVDYVHAFPDVTISAYDKKGIYTEEHSYKIKDVTAPKKTFYLLDETNCGPTGSWATPATSALGNSDSDACGVEIDLGRVAPIKYLQWNLDQHDHRAAVTHIMLSEDGENWVGSDSGFGLFVKNGTTNAFGGGLGAISFWTTCTFTNPVNARYIRVLERAGSRAVGHAIRAWGEAPEGTVVEKVEMASATAASGTASNAIDENEGANGTKSGYNATAYTSVEGNDPEIALNFKNPSPVEKIRIAFNANKGTEETLKNFDIIGVDATTDEEYVLHSQGDTVFSGEETFMQHFVIDNINDFAAYDDKVLKSIIIRKNNGSTAEGAISLLDVTVMNTATVVDSVEFGRDGLGNITTISVPEEDQNIKITFSKDIDLSTADYTTIKVLKDGTTPVEYEIEAEDKDEDGYASVVRIPYKYLEPKTNYTLEITKSVKNRAGESIKDAVEEDFTTYKIVLKADETDFVAEFKTLTSKTFADYETIYAKYITGKELIDEADIPATIRPTDASAERVFGYVQKMLSVYLTSGSEYGLTMAGIADTKNVLGAAVLVDELINGTKDAAKIAYGSYKSALGKLIVSNEVTFNNFYTIWSEVKANATTTETIVENIMFASALSLMIGAEPEKIADVIGTYHEILGADLSYATTKGVPLLLAARCCSFADNMYIYIVDFGGEFKNMVDLASEAMEDGSWVTGLPAATVSTNFNAWLWVTAENNSNGKRLIESLYDVKGNGNELGMNTTESFAISIPFRLGSGATTPETIGVRLANLDGMVDYVHAFPDVTISAYDTAGVYTKEHSMKLKDVTAPRKTFYLLDETGCSSTGTWATPETGASSEACGVVIDLGRVAPVKYLQWHMDAHDNRAAVTHIMLSEDGETWVGNSGFGLFIKNGTSNSLGINSYWSTCTFTEPVNARYIRVLERAGSRAVGHAIRVWGAAPEKETTIKKVEMASATSKAGSPNYAIDENAGALGTKSGYHGTAYTSVSGQDPAVTFNFKVPSTVEKIRIAFNANEGTEETLKNFDIVGVDATTGEEYILHTQGDTIFSGEKTFMQHFVIDSTKNFADYKDKLLKSIIIRKNNGSTVEGAISLLDFTAMSTITVVDEVKYGKDEEGRITTVGVDEKDQFIKISFNKGIDLASVNYTTIKLLKNGTTPVVYTPEPEDKDGDGYLDIVKIPYRYLESKTDYKLQITTDVKNKVGESLSKAVEEDFSTYKIILKSDETSFVNDFKALAEKTFEDYKTFYSTYITTKELIDDFDIPVQIKPAGTNAERVFGYIQKLIPVYSAAENKYGLALAGTADVRKVIEAAVVVDELINGTKDSAKVAYGKYSKSLGGLIVSNKVTFDNFYTVWTEVKANATTSDTIAQYISVSSALSLMIGGTTDDVANVINNNSTILGADLTYASNKGVTVLAAAHYCSFEENMAAYIKDFNTEFEKMVDRAYAALNGGGGAGGGGGGGNKPTGGNVESGTGMVDGSYIQPSVIPAPVYPEEEVEEVIKLHPFKDLAGYEWAESYIETCYTKGIVNGMSEDSFAPGDYVTREQFVKMIVSALNIKAIATDPIAFNDCDDTQWYYDFITRAYNAGVINGVSEINFGIGTRITRQDIAVMTYRANWMSAGDVAATFKDAGSIAQYAKQAVEVLASNGIINGYTDGSFAPNGYATRAEVCAVIVRLLDKNGGK